jgi:hypothetical protein
MHGEIIPVGCPQVFPGRRFGPANAVGRTREGPAQSRPSGESARMFHGEMPVWGVGGIRLVGAPTVGPDPCRAQQLPAGAQDDAEGFVFEDQGQACHGDAFPVVGY